MRYRHNDSESLVPFYFQNRFAGCIILEKFLLTLGTYRYMPVRSKGHYNFTQVLRGEDGILCHADINGQRCYFVVSSVPEYGKLYLSVQRVDKKPTGSLHKLLWNILYGTFKLLNFIIKFLFKIALNHD